MKVGSLFSGIGGIDLGLERAGMTVCWQVEFDAYCNRVLAKHWPHVKRYGDIRAVDWSKVEPVDLVAGGFPCQPVSFAGRGRAQKDDRWMWPEFTRCIRAIRPRHVLVENVPGLLVRGFGDVISDLAAIGYDAEWDCIPAAAFGAPHLRFRVWIVATDTRAIRCDAGRTRESLQGTGLSGASFVVEGTERAERTDEARTMADADSARFNRPGFSTGWEDGLYQVELGICGEDAMADADGVACRDERRDARDGGRWTSAGESGSSRAHAAHVADADCFDGQTEQDHAGNESRHAGEDASDGSIFDWWLVEPDVGRVAHGVPDRVDRLKGLGNAVVPQVVEWIGRRIMRTGRFLDVNVEGEDRERDDE